MPFNLESARKAGSKSKRGPVKPPPVKTKMAQLFEDLIQDLIKNKEKLSIQQKMSIQYFMMKIQTKFIFRLKGGKVLGDLIFSIMI